MKKTVLILVLALVACGDDDTDTNDNVNGVGNGNTNGNTNGNSNANDNGGEDLAAGMALDAAEASPGTWTWIPVAGAKCRDGSDTGFLVRLQPGSTEWVFYLEGGGACFDILTCQTNPSSFGEADVAGRVAGLDGAVFDDTDADNPVYDWNVAYIPYCTGDVFSGTREDVTVPNVATTQDFVGAINMDLFTDLLVDRYTDASRVLLTGSSAGGFGAAFNYDRVATKFNTISVSLLDDSGPPLAFGSALSPCLAEQWFDLWGSEFPADCTACAVDQDGLTGYAQYITDTYSDADFALSSYVEDGVIRFFFGFGAGDCTTVSTIDAMDFSQALSDFQTDLPSWATFYAPGDAHTFLRTPEYQGLDVDGVSYAEWLASFLDGTPTSVGP